MEIVRHFPLFTIILCFVTTVICSLLPGKKGKYVALGCQLICVALGFSVLLYSIENGSTIYQMGHLSYGEDGSPLYWMNNVIRFGVLESIMATIIPLVMFFSVLGGMKKMEEDVAPDKQRFYYVLTSLALVALVALSYCDDIFTGYVFLEISTLSSIGLIAIKNKGRTTVASIRYMIFNLVGSGLYLIGIVLLYDLTGYFMLEKILPELTNAVANGSLPAVTCSLSLIVVGLGIKSGLFPFYFWMADTYGESTTASASIISGLISKGYIFLLIKLVIRGFGFEKEIVENGISYTQGVVGQTGVLNIVFYLGICGMILGSVSALFEKRINKMIAYSSAAQIGYIYLALGLGEVGIKAAILQIICHMVTKPLLFVSARGLIDVSDHKPQFVHLRGSGKRNPFAGFGFTIGALSMIGFPLLAGFAVKYWFIETAVSGGISKLNIILTIAALVISTLLNTCYMIHTVITIYSPSTEENEVMNYKYKNRPGFIIACIGLIILNVFVGSVPSLVNLITNGISMMI